MSYTKSIHEEVRTWVAGNIRRWQLEKPPFFKIDMIPNDLLPEDVLEAEGGARRKVSTVSVREMVGLEEDGRNQVHPLETRTE